MNNDPVPILYASVTKGCETFSFIHAHSNCNWVAFKASITIGIRFLRFSTFPLVFILPNKCRKTKTTQNLKFLVLIYSLPFYRIVSASSRISNFYYAHIHSGFFFLRVCKILAGFFPDLHVCLIFALNLI